MAYRIDRTPPVLSGKPEEDVKPLQDYIVYLHEQLNYLLGQIDRRLDENEGGERMASSYVYDKGKKKLVPENGITDPRPTASTQGTYTGPAVVTKPGVGGVNLSD